MMMIVMVVMMIDDFKVMMNTVMTMMVTVACNRELLLEFPRPIFSFWNACFSFFKFKTYDEEPSQLLPHYEI